MERTSRIGSSDIAGIAGIDDYNTPIKIYQRKIGEIDDIEDNDSIWFGNAMEEIVAHRWAEKNNVQITRSQQMFQHPEYPWATATPDYIHDDKILEIKTTEQFWDNGIPDRVTAQVTWQMGIAGYKKAIIVALGHRRKLLTFELDFDQALFDGLLTLAKNFYENHMLLKVPPPPLDGRDLESVKNLYQNVNDTLLNFDVDAEMNDLIEQWQGTKGILSQINEQLKLTKENLSFYEAQIRFKMKDSKLATCNGAQIICKESARKGYIVEPTTIKTFNIKKDN